MSSAGEGDEPPRRFYFGDLFKTGGYEPLHPELFKEGASAQWASRWLAPGFRALSSEVASGGDAKPSLKEEAPGVYSFDFLTPEFCDLLLEEVEHAQRTRRDDLDRPNGMNRYGIVLNQLGLEPIITALQQEHLRPIQEKLFPSEGAAPDDHHCFIVRYKAGEDVGLDMHEDDSDVTLNVCLGKQFTGATLSFCGLASDVDHRKFKHTYEHQKGRAVVHRGRHRHGADNIDTGERVNLILWSVSSTYRESAEFRTHRTRDASAGSPDPVCLSYTHDRDYTQHLAKPSDEEAVRRGVMLDVVERREAEFDKPVHDLARPIAEINKRPSVCLFCELSPPQMQRELFEGLMSLAQEVLSTSKRAPHEPPPLLFFIGVQPMGAVPQVRSLSGAKGSPALVILDIDKEQRYMLREAVAPQSVREFVESYLRGDLRAEPLGEEGEAPADGDDGPPAGASDGGELQGEAKAHDGWRQGFR